MSRGPCILFFARCFVSNHQKASKPIKLPRFIFGSTADGVICWMVDGNPPSSPPILNNCGDMECVQVRDNGNTKSTVRLHSALHSKNNSLLLLIWLILSPKHKLIIWTSIQILSGSEWNGMNITVPFHEAKPMRSREWNGTVQILPSDNIPPIPLN